MSHGNLRLENETFYSGFYFIGKYSICLKLYLAAFCFNGSSWNNCHPPTLIRDLIIYLFTRT